MLEKFAQIIQYYSSHQLLLNLQQHKLATQCSKKYLLKWLKYNLPFLVNQQYIVVNLKQYLSQGRCQQFTIQQIKNFVLSVLHKDPYNNLLILLTPQQQQYDNNNDFVEIQKSITSYKNLNIKFYIYSIIKQQIQFINTYYLKINEWKFKYNVEKLYQIIKLNYHPYVTIKSIHKELSYFLTLQQISIYCNKINHNKKYLQLEDLCYGLHIKQPSCTERTKKIINHSQKIIKTSMTNFQFINFKIMTYLYILNKYMQQLQLSYQSLIGYNYIEMYHFFKKYKLNLSQDDKQHKKANFKHFDIKSKDLTDVINLYSCYHNGHLTIQQFITFVQPYSQLYAQVIYHSPYSESKNVQKCKVLQYLYILIKMHTELSFYKLQHSQIIIILHHIPKLVDKQGQVRMKVLYNLYNQIEDCKLSQNIKQMITNKFKRKKIHNKYLQQKSITFSQMIPQMQYQIPLSEFILQLQK